MKQIVVIDENKGIKNELPEEYENLEVNFARYYKYEFIALGLRRDYLCLRD